LRITSVLTVANHHSYETATLIPVTVTVTEIASCVVATRREHIAGFWTKKVEFLLYLVS